MRSDLANGVTLVVDRYAFSGVAYTAAKVPTIHVTLSVRATRSTGAKMLILVCRIPTLSSTWDRANRLLLDLATVMSDTKRSIFKRKLTPSSRSSATKHGRSVQRFFQFYAAHQCQFIYSYNRCANMVANWRNSKIEGATWPSCAVVAMIAWLRPTSWCHSMMIDLI